MAIFDQPIANIILNGEKLKPFHLKSGMRKAFLLSSFLFSTVLDFLARPNKARKRKISDTNRKKGVKLFVFADDMFLYLKRL
jgi:hypothetical protein